MIDRTNPALVGFDDTVLERWGLKPTAKDTLNRAKERGAITPQEISEMISTALTKDRQKMAEVLQELKKILQNLNISVTFNVVHTHTHIVQSPAIAPTAPAPKPKLQPKAEEQTVPPLAVAKGPQYAGEGHGSPFLNAKLLREQGLVPEALGILLVAKTKGQISPQQIGNLIPAEISQDNAKLRTTMRWITQLLGAIGVKIVIGEVHYKKPESHSPETSYSRRPESPSSNRGKLPPLFNSNGLSEAVSEEPSKEALLEMEQGEVSETEGEESEHADPNGEFIPKFIFDRESGVTNPYYRSVKDHKFLKHQDLLELARRWHMHGDYEARNTIVVHNLRLSMKIASHYMGRGLDYDDLVQEGNMGLMVAAERFDPEKGFHFTTYATWWVRQHMVRAIQNYTNVIRLPVWVTEVRNKILKITCELGMELQREPTLEEVAARAEKSTDEVKKILHQLKVPVVSLEELAYGASDKGNEVTIGDLEEDPHFPSPETALEAKENLQAAADNLRTLLAAVNALDISDNAKTAFKMYYGLEGHPEGHTLESIAPTFDVTRERVRQLNKKVWEELDKHGIAFDDQKLTAAIKQVHDLEDFVGKTADTTSPIEDFVLDAVSIAFQDESEVGGDMVPAVIITPKRPPADLEKVKPGTSVPEEIIRVVGEVYGVAPEIILGDERPKETVWVRWVCTYIMREELKSSFVGIGQALHYADHTTAIYGYRSLKKTMERDPAVADEIEKIIGLCGFRKEKQETKTVESVTTADSPIVDQVLTLTSQAFGVEKSSLFARSNTRPDEKEKYRIRAKCFAMYTLRSDFNIQCQEIAQIFGFGDYSRASVLCSGMAEEIKTDADLQAKLALVRAQYSLEVYKGDLGQVKQCQKILFPKQVEELKGIVDTVVKPFKEKVQ